MNTTADIGSDMTSDIGLVGLAVMGQNLALNIADHGYNIAVFNRNPERTNDFIAQCKAAEPSAPRVAGYTDVAAFVQSIKRPRKIILLVKAGRATDDTISTLLPHLEAATLCGVTPFAAKRS
jgi:6-phosphogluconate dehydrogenase